MRAAVPTLLFALGGTAWGAEPPPASPRPVDGGVHTPFYPASVSQRTVSVGPFRLDATPVTVDDYRAFVVGSPEWQKGDPPAIFADSSYLRSWTGPTEPSVQDGHVPVTEVSWFAARAYCQSKSGALPTVHQWEYAADATATAPHGARKDPQTLALILAWYGEGPAAALRPVAQRPPNHWGLHDMHAGVWEWTLDFSSLLISADNRESGEAENLRFCGAGALSAQDVEDYASFMRFAMRSSLSASSTTANMGFRCAYPR